MVTLELVSDHDAGSKDCAGKRGTMMYWKHYSSCHSVKLNFFFNECLFLV